MAAKIHLARMLRRNQTDAERALWFRLRNRRLNGLKFRRQVSIDRFVVDFCCESARLVIEIDGGQHDVRRAEDSERTTAIEARGYLVLRFWNSDVLKNIDGVLQTIAQSAHPVPPHPSPLPAGEREHR